MHSLLKSRLTAAITTMCLLSTAALSGCALLRRSNRATHVESEPAAAAPQAAPEPTVASAPNLEKRIDTEPAPQTIQSGRKTGPHTIGTPNAPLEKAEWLFHQAQREQNDGALEKASELWHQFIDQYVGLPGYHTAIFNYGYCLYYLGRARDALEPLKMMIQETQDSKLINDARILLAESLLQTNQSEEALATTFDVLPNHAGEQAAGLERSADAVGMGNDHTAPSLTQKIRLYTIRGRIFAALKKDNDAHVALEHAKQLLLHSSKGQISPADMRFLSGNYAWRQIEIQALSCQQRFPVPDRLSEAEFLTYADAYYDCASPARHLYCTVLAARNEQIRSQAISIYKGLVEAPLEIRNHLPPPAREIRKKEQRSHYESEMKALIEKTVSERAKDFKELPSCHAHDVF